MTKVLMVCLGNICRSPMAEGLLRHKAEEAGIELEIDSCGTSGYHIGEAPDPRAMSTMLSKGIDISSLKARQLATQDFEDFDYIFTMDESNYENTLDAAPTGEWNAQVVRFLDYCRSSSERNVPDPYFGGDAGFEHVYRLLEDACDSFLDSIK